MMNPILAALVKPDDQPITGSYQGWLSHVRFPLLCTPKIDGIRCRIFNKQGWSRSNKLIPNLWVQEQIAGSNLPSGLDGELIVVDKEFNDTQSEIMTGIGAPDFRYLLFDWCDEGQQYTPYDWRASALATLGDKLPEWCKVLPVTRIESLDQLIAYQDSCIAAGFEGWCGRRENSIYKEGRSTFKQHYLLKGKLFEDAEGLIIDSKPLLHNENPASLDQLGFLKRSKHKANMVPSEMLGALLIQDLKSGMTFWLGGGFTQQQRIDLWQQRDSLPGKLATYRHQPYGAKDRPRILTFKGIRYDL